MKIFQALLTIFVCLILIFQPLTPSLVLAQEATPSSQLSQEPSSATPSAQLSENQLTLNNESSSSAQLTPNPSPWQTVDGVATTTSPVVLGQTYHAPQNDQVTVTFAKLPENPGTLTIKQVTVSTLNTENLNPVTDTAYDITSTMTDGTFEYTLTLPTPTTENVEVKASEDGQTFVTLGGVSPGNGVLSVTSLNHFTVFVVVGTILESSSTPFDESQAEVVINEFVYNALTEWVEVFNRGSSSISLSGWRIEDGNNLTTDDLSLTGTLPASGMLVFQRSSGWLNNDADTINLKNDQGTVVDKVSYKDTVSTVVGADNVGSVGTNESVGRTLDGVISGDIWTKYSEPTKGYNNSGTPTFINVGSNFSYTSIRDALGDIAQGGTINVLSGSYNEADIEVTKANVTIQGPGIGQGVSRAIVNGSSCGDVSPSAIFHLHADGITLKGFEIDPSNCGAEHVVHIGGGSEEFQVAGVTVTQNVIYSATYGVTISLASSYDRERPNIVSENDISQNQSAGIYLFSASNNIIRDNKIHDNNSYGILLNDGGSGPSNNNQIINNTIKDHSNDAGIYSSSSVSGLVVTGNEITGNYTGIYLNQIASSLTISGNKVNNHNSYGIYLSTISGATVLIGGTGLGDGNTITGNGSDDDGSGIYFNSIQNGSTVNVLGNTVSQNGSSSNDPGIFIGRASGRQNSLTLRNNTITNNSGRGLDVGTVTKSTLDVSTNTISGNNYAGLFISSINDSVATIDGNTIVRNGVSERNSGMSLRTIQAIVSTSSATISNNTISQNGDRGIDVFRVTNANLTIGPGNTISSNRGTGINLQFRVAGTVITRNTLAGNGGVTQTAGIVVRKALGNEAHLNNISGNGVGVQNNDSANAFNAIENWWGSTLGPQSLGADRIGGNVLFKPWCLDANCKNVFTQAPEGSLLKDVSFGIPPGRTLSDTPSLSFLSNSVFNVSHLGGTSNVTIPSGVVINRSDGQNLDVNNLAAKDVSLTSLSGLGTGVVADGALQWGLPNIELTFSSAINLSIFVGNSFNGQTLTVQRSTTGTGGWTTAGIVSPGTCVVSAGLCTFQATKASYFATTRTVSSSTSTTSSTSGGGGGGGPVAAPTCGDTKPGSVPTLTGAGAGTNSVTLTWLKAKDPVTYYLVTYGLSAGSQQFGNPNVGGKDTTSYTVSELAGGTTYYFKVRAGNGCAPGDYSNELSATPGGGFVSGPAAGFAPGVLAVITKEATPSATETSITASPQEEAGQSAFPVKTAVVVVIVLLLGFGVFRLLIK